MQNWGPLLHAERANLFELKRKIERKADQNYGRKRKMEIAHNTVTRGVDVNIIRSNTYYQNKSGVLHDIVIIKYIRNKYMSLKLSQSFVSMQQSVLK